MSKSCSPTDTNISTLNHNMITMIERHKFKLQPEYEKKYKDEKNLSSANEKAILEVLFDRLGKYNEQMIDGRNIKLPSLIDIEINRFFNNKGKIIWYGSTSIGKENISDYDLMFIPNNYDNESFKMEHMENMYEFMNGLRNALNDKVKDLDITKILKDAEPIYEIFDTFVKINYRGNPFGSSSKTQLFEKYESDSKVGSFKLSIIPYLWINNESIKGGSDENNGIVFCLFRIKYVFKLNGNIITVPVVDLSYHFCNRVNSLIESITNFDKNYIQFNNIIYVKTNENLKSDLKLKLISAFKDIDVNSEQVSKTGSRLAALAASASSRNRRLTGGKMKSTKRTKKSKRTKKTNKTNKSIKKMKTFV